MGTMYGMNTKMIIMTDTGNFDSIEFGMFEIEHHVIWFNGIPDVYDYFFIWRGKCLSTIDAEGGDNL